MSKKRVHLLRWGPEPNESDPVGYEYALCGNEAGTVGSHYPEKVTCTFCLKRLASEKAKKTKP